MPFFNIDNYFIKYPFLKKFQILAFVGPRNIGKSTDMYKHIIKNGGFTKQEKVLLLRNSDEEIKMMRQDFNDRFKNKYMIVGNSIYLLKKEIINKDNEEIPIYKKDDHIGYIAAISTYIKMKSVEAKDVKWIFYEEFNEDTAIGKNIYPKFINLITTFIRFNKVKLFMLGNKDGFASDYYINWDIIPKENNDKDELFYIKDRSGKPFGCWLELGNDDFKDLGNENTLFYKLAMLDNRTKSYINGGYLQNISPLVKNYKELIKNASPMFYLAIKETKYIFFKYLQNNYCIISPWNYPNNDLPIKTYSLDLISRLIKETQILDNDDMAEIVKGLLNLLKQGKIYFDSYDTLQIFKDLTLWLKKLE